jgi:TonB-linked SusC/RagA family outer membrane protein
MKINAFKLGMSFSWLPPKILLIMKLTIIIMTTFLMQVSAAGFAQRVTLKEKEASLENVFEKIRIQTKYDFVFNSDLIKNAKKVNLNLQNVSLEEALNNIFENQSIIYSIKDKFIVLEPKKKTILDRIVGTFNTIDIKGKVVDEKGSPLTGATVKVKGTKQVITTDLNGEFRLKGVNNDESLEISFIGYVKKVIKANSDLQFIVLTLSDSKLDEVQVIAYGSDTKRFSIGSVATVTAKQIEDQPVTNVLLALQGQAPGLAISATSGVPGARVQVQVRGQNTLLSNPNGVKPYDQPLFIIDGTPFAPQNNDISQLGNLAYNGGTSSFVGMSPFNGINPADIESISILKDADATSIYGTQGSNGVIIITTKRGKAGKTAFNLTANTNFSTAAKPIKLMSAAQYFQLRRDAFAADNVTPTAVNGGFGVPGYAPDLMIYDQNKYTDWQKTIYGKTTTNTDLHGSLSGGSENNTFLISAGYTYSNFNFPGEGYADQRMSMHSALGHTSINKKLTVDLTMDLSYGRNNSPGFGGGANVLLPPNMPDLIDANGNLVWTYKGVDIGVNQFYAYLKKPTLLQSYNQNNTLRLGYKILSDLNFSVNMGYSRTTSAGHFQNPAAAQSPAFANANARFSNNSFQSINIEPQLDYTYVLGKGVITALLGGTYRKNRAFSNVMTGNGYSNDNFLESINGAATVFTSDDSDIYKYVAGFARLKYVYDQKYILSLTGRRDGSSNFVLGRKFGNFGSAGAGWIFSEEKGFKSIIPLISYGKLSGSYGTSGTDGVEAYQYQALWQLLGTLPTFQGVRPNSPYNLFNSDYSWALKKTLNVALDLGFFQDRLLLNATYYQSREGNQLGGYLLPAQAGFPSVLRNMPATIQNHGWEFSANSTNIKTKDFTWATNFNITFNRNKLLSFTNLESSPYNSKYVIGQPTSLIMGYKFKGLNPTTGVFEYYDRNGNTTITPKSGIAAVGGDQVPIANLEIKYMGGIGNTFSYKRLSLLVFFQFSSRTSSNYLAMLYGAKVPGFSMNNQPVAALDYWKKPGDQTALQKLSVSNSSAATTASRSFSNSSGAYSDNTYLRLKTMSLNYSLPDALLQKAHIRGCRVFVNAQNLMTFTNFKVGDPELGSDFTAVPLQRVVAFGLNLNL